MPGLFDDLIPNTTVDRVSRGILGEEKGTPRSVSPQGARGTGQIEPGTFKQYALPGENIDNDKDNRAVHRRMIYDFVVHKNMDPGQAATAYFSGEGNVARGGATPWKQNRGDVNESTSSYVAHAESRMKPARRLFEDLIPKGAAPPKKGLFDDLIPKQEPWRVPKANEGQVVHAKRGLNMQGPQQGAAPVSDPEIAARQKQPVEGLNIEKKAWEMLRNDPMAFFKKLGSAVLEEGKALADPLTLSKEAAQGKLDFGDPETQQRIIGAGTELAVGEAPGGVKGLAGRAPRAIEAGAAKEIPVDKFAAPAMPTLDPKSTRDVASIAGQQAVEAALKPKVGPEAASQAPQVLPHSHGATYWQDELKAHPELRGQKPWPGNKTVGELADEESKTIEGTLAPSQAPQKSIMQIVHETAQDRDRAAEAGQAAVEGELNPKAPKRIVTPATEPDSFAKELAETAARREVEKAATKARLDAQWRARHPDTRTPTSVGAAAVPSVVQQAWDKVPPAPTNEFIQSADDAFFRLRQSATADRQQANEVLKALPPELKDSQVQKKLFQFSEGDVDFSADRGALTPKEQELYDKYIVPLRKDNADLWSEAQKMNGAAKDGIEDFDPNYMHRIVKGKSNEFDPWLGEASEANPIAGYKSMKAASQRERKYFAIESESGQRKVVLMTDHGPMIMEKGQPARPLPKYEGAASQPGDKFKLNGQEWTVGHAKTSEITGAGGPEYYQNAMASLIKNNLQLKAVVRAQYELQRLKDTPEFAAYACIG